MSRPKHSLTPAAFAAFTLGMAAAPASASLALAQKHACTACHGMDNKLVGPGFAEIARKYAGRADGEAYLADKVVAGGVGVWGAIAMPAQALSAAEARKIAAWLAQGAKK